MHYPPLVSRVCDFSAYTVDLAKFLKKCFNVIVLVFLFGSFSLRPAVYLCIVIHCCLSRLNDDADDNDDEEK